MRVEDGPGLRRRSGSATVPARAPAAAHAPVGLTRAGVLAWLLGLVAACGGSPLLGPDADQGIDGTVLIGPQCPVQSPDNPCPDEPYQATIHILDRGQHEVTTVHSDAQGHFRVGLEPGLYVLSPENGDPYPAATEQAVNVGKGIWSSVTIAYDTGIR